MRQQTQHRSNTPRFHANEIAKGRCRSIRARIGIGLVSLLLFASFAQVALAADGDLDLTFSSDGMRQVGFPGDNVYSQVTVATDAQANVFVGAQLHPDGPDVFAIAKLKPNGSTDLTFGSLGTRVVSLPFDAEAFHGIFPQPDGTLMLLGAVRAGSQDRPVMARLTASGTLDSSFGVDGRLVITETPWVDPELSVESATQQSDGKFLMAGTCLDCSGQEFTFLLRTSASGIPDPTFGNNGWASVVGPARASFWDVCVDGLGRAVLAGASGAAPNQQGLVLRVTPNGTLDTSFGTGVGYVQINALPNSYASAIAFDSNETIVVALVTFNSSVRQTGLVRLLADGSRDLGYAGGFRDLTLEFGSGINALQRRGDGRMVAAGWIDHTGAANGVGSDFFIARVLPNGDLDTGFDGNGVKRIALSATRDDAEEMVLSAGKPVIAGFSYVGTEKQLGVLRMQSDLIFSDGGE